jgi:cytochrome c biogenesis protein CcmG/thiol:disulfide interchange protein DsbE
MLRYGLPLALFLLVVGFLWAGLALDPRLVPSPLIDTPAPAFDLPELADPKRRMSQLDLHGAPTLVNIWASWCVACRDEHRTLLELAEGGALRVVGLNYKDQRDAALKWLDRLGNPYQAIAYDFEGRVAIDWGVYGVPESFLLDSFGIIRFKHVGPLTPAVVKQELMPRVHAMQRDRATAPAAVQHP